MRQFLALFASFTIGAMAVQLHNDRVITDLKVRTECAYHEGYDTGWRDASTGSLMPRKIQARNR